MNLKNKAPTKKKWPVYCFYAAIVMVLLAGVLYLIHCQNINGEFSHNKEFFGETFDELYAITDLDEDIADAILARGREALTTIGSGEEFGLCSRYCVDPAIYPDAHRIEAAIESVAGKIGKSSGYLWVAYHQSVYDANGTLVTASGSESGRILSRWSLEKTDDTWVVTEIREKP